MRSLTLIAAVGENNAIGKDNELLWHLPDDFKRFRKLTSGHKIIMGRKTFESFPKPLPNRIHIIVTRDKGYKVSFPDCIVVHSLKEALKQVGDNESAFIIGGGEIYRQGEVFSDRIELTRVHDSFEADTFFPEIDPNVWELTESEYHPRDDRHAHDFTFQTFVRK